MAHLGAFGETHEANEITFDYFGQTFWVNPELCELDYVDFMDAAESANPDTSSGVAFVKEFARLCIADFDGFWALARENKQTSTDIFKLLRAIVEQVADRPTGQPSGSSDGQQPTARRSTGDSSLGGRLDGRPDLQLMVAQAQQKAG